MGAGFGRVRGTTLVELLVSVIFMGIAVSAVLQCVTSGQTRAVYGRRRLLMLSQAQSEIEKVRAQARTAALTAASTSTSLSISGFTGTASMGKTIALVGGYTNLYRVTITITWFERINGRSDSLKLETYVRAPDA